MKSETAGGHPYQRIPLIPEERDIPNAHPISLDTSWAHLDRRPRRFKCVRTIHEQRGFSIDPPRIQACYHKIPSLTRDHLEPIL